MTNGLQLAQQSRAQWVAVHGGESLDQQCERLTGFYDQWVGTGTESGINGFTSAILAQHASQIYDTNPNGGQPGDVGFFNAPPFGHLGRWSGKDDNGGRTLIEYATALGDTVVSIGSGVKIGHADTYPHPFVGWAHGHDHNTLIPIEPYVINVPQPPAPSGGIAWGAGDTLKLMRSGPGYQSWEPDGPLAKDIMQSLVKRNRIGVSNFVADGHFGPETRKGIQLTLNAAHCFNGNASNGAIDGIIQRGGDIGIQTYAERAANYRYTGRVDGVPQQMSWQGFANFLREGL